MVTLPSHAAQTAPSGLDQRRLAPWRHQLHVRWVSIYFRWRHCFFFFFYRSLSSSSSSVTSNANGLYWWQIQNRSWQNDLCGFFFQDRRRRALRTHPCDVTQLQQWQWRQYSFTWQRHKQKRGWRHTSNLRCWSVFCQATRLWRHWFCLIWRHAWQVLVTKLIALKLYRCIARSLNVVQLTVSEENDAMCIYIDRSCWYYMHI